MQQRNDERREDHWHLDKTVSVSHLTATVSAIIVVAVFLSQQDTRITVLEKSQVLSSTEANEQKRIAREDLRRIEDKIDHLIQSQMGDRK